MRVDQILQGAEADLIGGLNLTDKTVLELGNKKNSFGLYQEWYTARGKVKGYRCLDINGEDGAIVADMRKPVSVGQADLVTNFGFTEHVGLEWEDQRQCWKNVLGMVKLGGWLACVTPKPPYWHYHGMWQPTLTFYSQLLSANGFIISKIDDFEAVHGKPVVRVLARKDEDVPFYWDPNAWRHYVHRTDNNEVY